MYYNKVTLIGGPLDKEIRLLSDQIVDSGRVEFAPDLTIPDTFDQALLSTESIYVEPTTYYIQKFFWNYGSRHTTWYAGFYSHDLARPYLTSIEAKMKRYLGLCTFKEVV